METIEKGRPELRQTTSLAVVVICLGYFMVIAEPAGHAGLVEVLLWEDDVDAAWQAAQHGGCTRQRWLDLARARAKERPIDAIPRGWSGDFPLLIGTAVAGPDVELGAVGGGESRVVEALAGHRVRQRAVQCLPLLVRATVAGPQLDQGAVGRAGPGDIHALAAQIDRAVAGEGPALRGAAVAVPHLDLRAVGGGVGVVVD